MVKNNGVKTFNCAQCDYKSSTSSNLKTHERIHTHEKRAARDLKEQDGKHTED